MSLSPHARVNPGGQCLASLLCCDLKGSRHVERQEIRKDQEPMLLHNHRAQCAFFLAMVRVCSLMETLLRPLNRTQLPVRDEEEQFLVGLKMPEMGSQCSPVSMQGELRSQMAS